MVTRAFSTDASASRQVSGTCSEMGTNENPDWHVLVDFDGTIAPNDPTDRLLECFAAPDWREIEAAWQSGKISSRECLSRQVELMRATPAALEQQIEAVKVDPGFAGFLEFCRRRGGEVTIVSDGFDRVVRAALRNARLSVPFFANALEWRGSDQWHLAFPHAQQHCANGGANCKCAHADWSALTPHIVVGDGRSDFCMAKRADFVIAKGQLADYCRSRGQCHEEFTDFRDVTAHVSSWLESRASTAQQGISPAR